MKVGFIGYGSMGSTMMRSFLASGALAPEQIIVASRREEAREAIISSYPGVRATSSGRQAARESDVLFLSVRSGEVKGVLDEIGGDLRAGTHLISINDGVTIGDLESVFPGKVTKAMPPITMEVGRGVTLVCHNAKVTDEDKAVVRALFGKVSLVREVPGDRFEVAGDLTSSAPAFLASFVELFAEAGTRSGRIGRDEAVELALETLYATARLMDARKMDAATLVNKVATKGGITEQGVKVLEEELPPVLDRLFQALWDRHEETRTAISRQFER